MRLLGAHKSRSCKKLRAHSHIHFAWNSVRLFFDIECVGLDKWLKFRVGALTQLRISRGPRDINFPRYLCAINLEYGLSGSKNWLPQLVSLLEDVFKWWVLVCLLLSISITRLVLWIACQKFEWNPETTLTTANICTHVHVTVWHK